VDERDIFLVIVPNQVIKIIMLVIIIITITGKIIIIIIIIMDAMPLSDMLKLLTMNLIVKRKLC